MPISGTPTRLYLFRLLTTSIPLPNGSILPMIVVCYLVQTSNGQNILIDTGIDTNRPAPLGAQPPENVKNVLEHLTDLSLTPDDIEMVIATHFDPDHSAYHDSFPKAEFVVQKTHYTTAREGQYPRYEATRHNWDHPALHYRMVEGDTELLPGLTLLETSGHAPGHQSVMIKLPNTGTIILAIDAVSQKSHFKPDRTTSPVDDNAEQAIASTKKLIALAETEQAALVVFGHDGGQWATLKIAPEFYD